MRLDFRVSSIDRAIFPGFMGNPPFYVDIKSALDPEVIRARGEPYQSIEDQVDNMLATISYQKARGRDNNVSVLHIISLLRLKPSDRAYFMKNFYQKAALKNLDTSSIAFINTSINSI